MQLVHSQCVSHCARLYFRVTDACRDVVPRMVSCAADYANCASARCCMSAGFECFERDTAFAQCLPFEGCPPSPTSVSMMPSATWTCRVLAPVAYLRSGRSLDALRNVAEHMCVSNSAGEYCATQALFLLLPFVSRSVCSFLSVFSVTQTSLYPVAPQLDRLLSAVTAACSEVVSGGGCMARCREALTSARPTVGGCFGALMAMAERLHRSSSLGRISANATAARGLSHCIDDPIVLTESERCVGELERAMAPRYDDSL